MCFLPVIYLGPNYRGGNEDNGDLLQKIPYIHCYTECPQHCSRPLQTHASAGDSRTLMGKSGSVPCGVTASFSRALVHIRFCLCPPRVCFPVLCQFWWFYGGVNDDLLQEGLCHTQVGLLHPEHLPLWQSTADQYFHRRYSNTILSQSLCGLWVLVCTRFI